jgi:hypothetical protein
VARELGPLLRSRLGDWREIHIDYPGGATGHFAWILVLLTSYVTLAGSGGLGVAELLAAAGAAAGLRDAPLWVRRWRLRGRLLRAPLVDNLTAPVPRGLVRLTGTIEQTPEAFAAPATGHLAVYARSLYWQATRDGHPSNTAREDVRAVPFRLRLDDGATVRIEPLLIELLDRPRRVRSVPAEVRAALGAASRGVLSGRPKFDQVVLAPGDRIEAFGSLTTDVSPAGEAAPGRGTPVVHTLEPGADLRILVRRLARAADRKAG